MNHLYHMVPQEMEGTILYPLNVLKRKNPELFKKHFKKYEGREHVTEQFIPTLNCLWNDVLHFTAVDPHEVKNALLEAGRKDIPELKFYRIDPNLFDPKLTTVYLYAQTKKEDDMKEENFEQYIPSEVGKYTPLPQITKDYYKEKIVKGERPLFFHRVPHILYKGSLDVSNLPIITV